MIGLDLPVLNGIVPSWADIKVVMTGLGTPLLDMKMITAINNGSTVEIGKSKGASGGRNMYRTTGAVEEEASMTLLRGGWTQLLRNFRALAPLRQNQRAISLVHFDINVLHTPPGSIEIFEYRIKGCRVAGRSFADAEGTDAQAVEVPLNPIQVVDVIDGVEIAML